MENISNDAKAIIEAGINAAIQTSGSHNRSLAVEQAVADAVGKLSLSYPAGKDAPVIDALLEIAQSYVHNQVSQSNRDGLLQR